MKNSAVYRALLNYIAHWKEVVFAEYEHFGQGLGRRTFGTKQAESFLKDRNINPEKLEKQRLTKIKKLRDEYKKSGEVK